MYNYDLYLQCHLFKSDPRNTPFLGATHRKALMGLEQGFNELTGLSILVGETGTGKTTLVRSMLASRDSSIRIAHISDSTLSFDAMLAVIAQELRIRPVENSPRGRLAALKTFCADLVKADRAVLIFDGAERAK